VSHTKGVTIYGRVASVGQHLSCYLERTKVYFQTE